MSKMIALATGAERLNVLHRSNLTPKITDCRTMMMTYSYIINPVE
jgi:hypothetical protein